MKTNGLGNQLTPGSGPQKKTYARPHSGRRRKGGAPSSGKINNRQSVQIGPSYYRPTYAAALQYISVHGRTSPLAEKIATNKLENQLTPKSDPQGRIYARPHPGQRRKGGAPPGGENQQWQSIQIGPSYYRPTYTAGGLVSINLCKLDELLIPYYK